MSTMLVKVWWLALGAWQVVTGNNVMLNKQAKQSSTSSGGNVANANDGDKYLTVSQTTYEENPYWQGDLQGFYIIRSVTISTGGLAHSWAIGESRIEISTTDIDCAGGREVTECGQITSSPDPSTSYTLNCPSTGPVRFVTVWRPSLGTALHIGEVEVDGTPATLHDSFFQLTPSEQLTTPTSSETAGSFFECSVLCLNSQPCLAFSYTPDTQLNCILATDVTTATTVSWTTYSIGQCLA